MANMSYCRFRNTVLDLDDCWNNMDSLEPDDNPEEFNARLRLIRLCCEIALNYCDEVDREIVEMDESDD